MEKIQTPEQYREVCENYKEYSNEDIIDLFWCEKTKFELPEYSEKENEQLSKAANYDLADTIKSVIKRYSNCHDVAKGIISYVEVYGHLDKERMHVYLDENDDIVVLDGKWVIYNIRKNGEVTNLKSMWTITDDKWTYKEIKDFYNLEKDTSI